MSQVAVQSDRRFRRAQVKPAKQRSHWPRLIVRSAVRLVVAIAVLYGSYRGAIVVAQARMLQIDRVVIHGNERMSTGEVMAVLTGLRGQSLLTADLDTWRARLLSSPWIRDAHLRRSLPSTVEVLVTERQPSGIGRIDGRLYLVDERGFVIDEYGPQYADYDLPLIDGLPKPDAEGSTDPARMDLAVRVIASLKPKGDIAKRLSQIDVSDPHNATVIVSGDSAVIQLGEDQFLSRLQSYLELAPTLREQVSEIDYVDLRFDSRVYVKPARSAVKEKKAAPAAKAGSRQKRSR